MTVSAPSPELVPTTRFPSTVSIRARLHWRSGSLSTSRTLRCLGRLSAIVLAALSSFCALASVAMLLLVVFTPTQLTNAHRSSVVPRSPTQAHHKEVGPRAQSTPRLIWESANLPGKPRTKRSLVGRSGYDFRATDLAAPGCHHGRFGRFGRSPRAPGPARTGARAASRAPVGVR